MFFDPYWEGWLELAAAIGKQAADDILEGAEIARQYQAVQTEYEAVIRELRRRPGSTRTRQLKTQANRLRRERTRLYNEFLAVETPTAVWYLTQSPLWQLTLTVLQMDEALLDPNFQQALQLCQELERSVPGTVKAEVNVR